jgi:hypothetical protein
MPQTPGDLDRSTELCPIGGKRVSVLELQRRARRSASATVTQTDGTRTLVLQ